MWTMFRSQQPMFPANGGPPPAAPPGIQVFNIGAVAAKAVTTQSITVPAGGVPAGATIFIMYCGSAFPSSQVDTAGNTYFEVFNSSTSLAQIFYAANCLALAPGNTITVTGLSSTYAISAFYATGLAAVNPVNTANQASGTSLAPSVTTSAPTTQTGELILGVVGFNGPNTVIATQDSTHEGGFSASPAPISIGTSGGSAPSNYTLFGGYTIWNATGSAIYAPALNTSESWAATIAALLHA